jgi:serine/threonine-protein kinase
MTGRTIAHYQVLERLGEGGMGVVYRALDTHLHRPIALKLLRGAALADAERKKRFVQEARCASSLNHPNIITIYDIDAEDGVDYIAMEYVAGRTLDHVIGGKALPPPELLKYAIQVADALAAAHAAGIMHRDLKPGNIMVTEKGLVKVLDFGLAKLAEPPEVAHDAVTRTTASSPHTEEGTAVGTPAYMSPEQVEGRKLDSRTDIFSFGAVLYEMASGRRPFHGRTKMSIMAAVLHQDPQPIGNIDAALPRELERVITRCLRKDPERRFQTMADLKVALEELKEESESKATAAGEWRASAASGRRWRRRGWLLLAAAGLALLAAALNTELLRRWLWRRSLPDRKHIAVLPFRSIGGDASQQAFCDGITEALTSALTKHGGFSVVPAVDARKLESAGQARREFGVNLVITGTVQRRGEELRVIVSLIDAVNQRQIEAEPLNWPVNKLHEMEDAVLSKIGDLLNVTALAAPHPLAAGGSQLPSAYDAYLRGRGYVYRYDIPGNLERALQQFETAVREDTKFALAHLGLADVKLRLYRLRREPPDLEAAQAAAARALELNPQLAGGHIVRGGILADMRQPDQAVRELETALQLDPHDPAGYRELASLHRSQKRLREAEQVYQRAIAARPGDWLAYSNLGVLYLSQQRYTEAEQMYRKVIELTPDNHLGYRQLGTTLHLLGRSPGEVESLYRQAIALNPTARALSNLGALLVFWQRYAEAVQVMERAAELSALETPGDYLPHGNLGDAYQLAGDSPAKAKQAWGRALEIVEKRLQRAPEDPELIATRALYRSKIGETAAALEDAERAAVLAPANATVRYRAALAFAVAASRSRALEEIAAAARLGFSEEQIRRSPELAGFRGDPVFEQSLSRTHQP